MRPIGHVLPTTPAVVSLGDGVGKYTGDWTRDLVLDCIVDCGCAVFCSLLLNTNLLLLPAASLSFLSAQPCSW